MSRHVAEQDRECPFVTRNTWAVFKVGALWRVLRPSRAWACHEQDACAGDFPSHAEALRWATDPAVREAWLDRPDSKFHPTGIDRDIWIEGLNAQCVADQPRGFSLFGPVKDAA
ncbi:hypothetical protein [Mycobacterium sp. BK086]|uniref:hypothetical protein n=1 Tax=Mycobacterium sp. BK086 TaxID=2512165 RepID=UPI00105B2112|nr:hypothetical protein [Mycobacterium sp. BK086]